MTTRITVYCTSCGHFEMNAYDITIRHCDDNGTSAYRFKCERCGMTSVHPIGRETIGVFFGAGVVSVEVWHLPAELSESHSGPPIDHEDMMAFHDLLERQPPERWFDPPPDQVDSIVR